MCMTKTRIFFIIYYDFLIFKVSLINLPNGIFDCLFSFNKTSNSVQTLMITQPLYV